MSTSVDAVVAVDVGGTSLKGALVGVGGEVLARLDARTPADEGGAAVVSAVTGLSSALMAAARGANVVGVAAVTPGQVEAGVVRFAANLGWRDVPLTAILTSALGVPAAVDNDVWAAALAESIHRGATADCFFVALGTGIGGAHVRGGEVCGGFTGAGGEIGHIPVYPDGLPCPCGQRGCLELYSSASAVGRRYVAAGGSPVGGADAVVARLGDDPLADQVWHEAVEALALALATSTMLLDPGVVVLGGGLAGAGATLLDPLTERLAARVVWRAAPPVELSVLGTDAGWRGAGLRAFQAAGYPPGAGVGAGAGATAVPVVSGAGAETAAGDVDEVAGRRPPTASTGVAR